MKRFVLLLTVMALLIGSGGCSGVKGKTYDAYLTPKGIRDFSYTDKDGQEISGFQFDYHMEFPEKD